MTFSLKVAPCFFLVILPQATRGDDGTDPVGNLCQKCIRVRHLIQPVQAEGSAEHFHLPRPNGRNDKDIWRLRGHRPFLSRQALNRSRFSSFVAG